MFKRQVKLVIECHSMCRFEFFFFRKRPEIEHEMTSVFVFKVYLNCRISAQMFVLIFKIIYFVMVVIDSRLADVLRTAHFFMPIACSKTPLDRVTPPILHI